MRLPSKVLDFEVGIGACPLEGTVCGDAWMGHEADIDFVVAVGARLHQLDLATAAFFGGRAKEDDFTGEGVLRYCMGCGDGSGDRDACYEIVPTGVPYPNECILSLY